MHGRGTVQTNCCNLHGNCHCGCGHRAPICTRTNARKYEYAGEYRQYIRGHNKKSAGIPTEKIVPLYSYLKRVYGTWSEVSHILDIPLSTIEGHIYSGKHVSKEVAARVSYVVRLHKEHPDRHYREPPK